MNQPEISPKKPPFLLVGQITRPHGVKGELRMRIMTDYPERIPNLDTVFLSKNADGSNATQYQLNGMRRNKSHGLLRLEVIQDRNEADRLRELYVFVRFEEAVPLEDDEFYLFQVIGLRVQTSDGNVIGTIRDVLETGANDVYVLDSPEHGEILFPITKETLIKHYIEEGYVLVNMLDGLLPK